LRACARGETLSAETRGRRDYLASDDADRREPVLAQHEIEADPRALRRVLNEVEHGLSGINGRTRRKAVLLVAALADHWLRLTPDKSALMRVEIERSQTHLRIVASASDEALPQRFWERVGHAVAVGLVDSWGIDRRGRHGAWFEVDTDEF